MKITIIGPFRPVVKKRTIEEQEKYETAVHNVASTPSIHQDENGFWHEHSLDNEIAILKKNIGDMLIRYATALHKNSVYKHKLMFACEPDVFFNENYKKKFEEKYNIHFFSAKQKIGIDNTVMEAILSISDDEIVCYDYIVDLVCGKYWDKYIKEAFDKYGDEKVYVPMFIEPREKISSSHMNVCGPAAIPHMLEEETTTYHIWNTWRKKCCHALSMKPPIDRDYMIEKDLDDWSAIASKFEKDVIIEPCGLRDYGYYATLIGRNKIFKKVAAKLVGAKAYDLLFDNSLGVDKVVVTKSHVFHLHNKIKLDNIEVEHE